MIPNHPYRLLSETWIRDHFKGFIKFFLAIAAVAWIISQGSYQVGYNWQWYRIPKYIASFENGILLAGPLLTGLQITLYITAVSLLLSVVFGLVTALLRLSDSLIAKSLARIYLEAIRNTPLLVQLFFIYFVISPIIGLNRFSSAVLALSFFEGAYASEIFRAGILSISKGQWEAAYGLGFSTFQSYRYVILPQGIRKMLPPLTGQAVSLIKDSALVSTIAITDLTMQGQAIIAETFLAFEVWFTVAAIYLILNLTLSGGVSIMEKSLKQKERPVERG